MSDQPIMFEVMFADVTDVVVSRDLASTTLPCTNQPDFTAYISNTMVFFEVVGGRTAVNRLPAFATLGICVKA